MVVACRSAFPLISCDCAWPAGRPSPLYSVIVACRSAFPLIACGCGLQVGHTRGGSTGNIRPGAARLQETESLHFKRTSKCTLILEFYFRYSGEILFPMFPHTYICIHLSIRIICLFITYICIHLSVHPCLFNT